MANIDENKFINPITLLEILILHAFKFYILGLSKVPIDSQRERDLKIWKIFLLVLNKHFFTNFWTINEIN